MTRLRVRGIYTTALTKMFLDEGYNVVDVSEAIDRRFNADFDDARPDVTVETTYDSQGLRLSGDATYVDGVSDLIAGIGRDVFVWDSDHPKGAVYNTEVTETIRSGAVVSVPDADSDGFLPYSNSDEHIDEGDRLRVTVVNPEPPWSSRKPGVSTGIRVEGELLDMSRDAESKTEFEGLRRRERNEVSRIADMLGLSPPDGWGTIWKSRSADAEMSEIGAEAEELIERAKSIESAVSDAPKPENGSPLEVHTSDSKTVWIWFGRDARSELDEIRHEVTTTTEGHHRIKAGSGDASAAVDFFEAVHGRHGEFPFEGVVEAFGPSEGDEVNIVHGKPDGRRIELGDAEVVSVEYEEESIVVERRMSARGDYDELDVEKEKGDVAVTRFTEGSPYYTTVYTDEDGEEKGAYINISTEVEVFPDRVRYVDLHVDVVRRNDGKVETVDEPLLRESVEEGHVPEELAETAVDVAEEVEEKIKDQEELLSR
ncbi:DUF402 domain-containing protein [Halorutilales archaeon Cl-col2-1]